MSEPSLSVRKGICENPECDLCISRTVQEIEPDQEFVCAECGAPLRDYKDKKTHKGPKDKHGNGFPLIPVIAGVVVAIAAFVLIYIFFIKEDQAEVLDETLDNTTEVIDESGEGMTPEVIVVEPGQQEPAAAEPAAEPEKVQPKPEDKPAPAPAQPTSGKSAMGCGMYSGPLHNGVADGMGGTFTFTRAAVIDLNDGYGTKIECAAGDKIVDTKFTDGRLRQGEIHFKDGSRKYISGLNQKL